MTSLAVYSEQPVLTAGLQSVVAGLKDFTPAAVFTELDPLMEHVKTRRPSVVLLEATAAITYATLSEVKIVAGDAPIVLWVNIVAMEFVAQALALGVRGILRKSLPIELQVKCLRNVAAGDLWVEQGLCDQLLTTKRVALTRRERQLVSLLAQGLKNKEIAYAMTLTEGTVKVYLSRLFQKVGANDRFELALFALKNLFIDSGFESEPARAAGGGGPPARFPLSVPSFVNVMRHPAVVR